MARPVFPLSIDDVEPETSRAAAIRERDDHLGTFIIGLFLGVVVSLCCVGFGKWVF